VRASSKGEGQITKGSPAARPQFQYMPNICKNINLDQTNVKPKRQRTGPMDIVFVNCVFKILKRTKSNDGDGDYTDMEGDKSRACNLDVTRKGNARFEQVR